MYNFEQADRMKNVPLSKIREMVELSTAMEKEGKPIIHLEIGEPDFDTPKHICEAAKEALDAGKVHYGPVVGYEDIRKAVGDEYKKKYGLEFGPEEVMITHGVTHGIYLSMLAFLNPGDEILVPDPGFLCYFTVPEIAQAKPVSYYLDPENEYQIVPGSLDSLITEHTKMILLNSPSNPCGFALNEASLKEIARVAEKYDLIVISDEVYADIIYDGKRCMSIAELPGMRDRTIILNGFSKYYAMTGWRIGYLLCSEKLLEPMMRLSFYSISCPNSFVQAAAVAALQGDDTPSAEMVAEYERRRNFIYEAVNQIPGCSCQKPDSAFYMFVNIKKTGMTSDEFCKYILKECYVTMTPGTAFGNSGEGYVRISYANSLENLREAARRMKEVLEKVVK